VPGARLKILAGFALTGFAIGPAVTFFSAQVFHQRAPNQRLLAVLCPPSLLSPALQGSAPLGHMVGWVFLYATNAFLYALIGIVVALLVAS